MDLVLVKRSHAQQPISAQISKTQYIILNGIRYHSSFGWKDASSFSCAQQFFGLPSPFNVPVLVLYFACIPC